MKVQSGKISICSICGRPEYFSEFRWLNGMQLCRDCYKEYYESVRGCQYIWNDLDGDRPTLDQYMSQKREELSNE